MPYATIADLPPEVKSRYSDRCQEVFRKAWNRANSDGQSEASSFKIAHTAAGMCKGAGKAFVPMKATVIDDDAFRLLAIPFSGPLPSPQWPRGVDLDRQTFTERTDIKPSWFKERVVDWHHGGDPLMKRTILGKAVDLGHADGASDMPDEEGWWVTVWLDHGNRRLNLIKRLADQGAQIYGSSESLPGMVKADLNGEIRVWPYIRQTLSTSPQNTHSVLRPLKALLDGAVPTAEFWSVVSGMTDLGVDLRATLQLAGEDEAKAGRMFSSANEADIRAALEEADAAFSKLRDVLKRQPDYAKRDEAVAS